MSLDPFKELKNWASGFRNLKVDCMYSTAHKFYCSFFMVSSNLSGTDTRLESHFDPSLANRFHFCYPVLRRQASFE